MKVYTVSNDIGLFLKGYNQPFYVCIVKEFVELASSHRGYQSRSARVCLDIVCLHAHREHGALKP